MKSKFFRNALRIMSVMSVMTFTFVSCSTADEPAAGITESKEASTRSLDSKGGYSLTEADALGYAKDCLGLKSMARGSYTLDYVLSKGNLPKENEMSDTLAYVVNVNKGKGFVVIVNDTRIDPVISYSKLGNVKVVNGTIDHPILKDLDKVIVKILNSNGQAKVTSVYDSGDHKHCIINNPIKTIIHEGDPFNRYVVKAHPGCKAGSVPTCASILLAYTQETFRYNGYIYNLPDYFNCLEKGPGAEPVYPGINPLLIGDKHDQIFIANYAGAVSAFGNLIYDLGKNMNTVYSKVNTVTDPVNAYNVLNSTTCTLSDYYDYEPYVSVQDLWSLIYQGYYVMFIVGDSTNGGQMTIMITGGENIYTGSNPEIAQNVGFNAYVAEKDSEMICCSPSLLEHIGENRSFFGIK